MTLASLRRLPGLLGPAALLLLGCGRDPIAQGTGTGSTSADDGASGDTSAIPGGTGTDSTDTGTTKPDCAIQLGDIARGIGGFAMDGEATYDHSGYSVSGAGDVNGDGLADVIVGASGAEPNGYGSGRTYVVFGKANTGPVQLTDVALGIGGFAVDGEAGNDASGRAVSGAGDVNGDGLADVVVGARDAPNGDEIGRSYVVFGKTDAASVQLTDITAGTGGFVLIGEATEDRSGLSVGAAGDVNGDGLADVVVGAPYADPSGSLSGRTYVVFGKADTDSVSLADMAAGVGGFVLDGEAGRGYSGWSVSGAGDVNGDGLADVIVGAPRVDANGSLSGRAYLVFGKADTEKVVLSDVVLGLGGFVLNGEAKGDQAGWSTGAAGDVNGDGIVDVVVGARFADPNGEKSGRSFVVFGKADTENVELADVAQGSGGFAMDGEAEEDWSGSSVSGAGDVNGDGLADVIVGAPSADPNGSSSGRTYVVFGKAGTDRVSLSDVARGVGGFALDGEAEYDGSGKAVSGAGDVNGDGLADLVVGAPSASPNASWCGRTYVVFGGELSCEGD